MAHTTEDKNQQQTPLKRGRKPRINQPTHLPSPDTRIASNSTEGQHDASTGLSQPSDKRESSPPFAAGLHSPPSDTQPYSQFLPPPPISYEPLVLRRRAACPVPQTKVGRTDGKSAVPRDEYLNQEESYEKEKADKGVPAGGYLIGRHPECGQYYFLLSGDGDQIAVVEDLSGNGTYVNNGIIGRNKRRDLYDGDELSILDVARFIFRYPSIHDTNGFRQQYSIQGQLGKGHFATVYLCTEKCSGARYAVKKFEKRRTTTNSQVAEEKSRVDGLQQEIGVLMGVSHPNVLCLKDTFDESDGVYLVLELAPEGELFNWIVAKHKLSEPETRKIFVQLFQGIKYLPENILLIDRDLNIKIADFGLAKIIGEESFTSTLCGTPSYVAPEILEQGNRRRYTRAVDVWSLGVVLYICLCGFPPFSDELYSPENPYTLSQQIRMGRFDYPSPYWDSVGDPALDLIDKMLTVDVEKRITIDECLEHPWTTGRVDGNMSFGTSMESTDGLTGAMDKLDFSKRKPVRERTLLSSINDATFFKTQATEKDDRDIKVWDQNKDHNKKTNNAKEEVPAHKRDPDEFVKMGGKGDETLYGDEEVAKEKAKKADVKA
ncbi:unnamed protein product [Aureobasidium pullulans]|nr:unnamed protein product [Aureobasidium pullulans]